MSTARHVLCAVVLFWTNRVVFSLTTRSSAAKTTAELNARRATINAVEINARDAGFQLNLVRCFRLQSFQKYEKNFIFFFNFLFKIYFYHNIFSFIGTAFAALSVLRRSSPEINLCSLQVLFLSLFTVIFLSAANSNNHKRLNSDLHGSHKPILASKSQRWRQLRLQKYSRFFRSSIQAEKNTNVF